MTMTNRNSPLATLPLLLFLAAFCAWGQPSGPGCTGAPCLNPSSSQADALFGRIEQRYPQYFPPTSSTQTQQINASTAQFRIYGGSQSAGLATYQGGLWYALGGNWTRYSTLDEGNAQFCGGACWPAASIPGQSTFKGSLVLGAPTATSVRANVFSPDQSGTARIVYGAAPGSYDQQTPALPLSAGKPLEFTLDKLSGNTRYYYRLEFEDASGSGATDESSFHTARASGSTFTFAVQGDSHPERERSQFQAGLYTRTLQTAAADRPDFFLTIGDDFSVDTLSPLTVNMAQVTERYAIQRPYLGLIGKSAPVFLVNGNHEQAARYLLDGTPNNVAVWAQNARNTYYPQPAPDGFYSGNSEQVPHVGLLRNYFAWTWGDALFVVIDPYWSSPGCVDEPFDGGAKRTNLWDITHGDAQYQWLKATLEQSSARYKFVFAHHVLGTGRGGIELAGLYEWGGHNGNGTWGFTTNRPSWVLPIHQLMVANHVTIFFQGHDHIWARQSLDGITYQTLSEPADPNYTLYNADAYRSGDRLPNTGYTRVTVAPTGVKVDYVRTFLPADETAGRVSGATAFSYTLP